jgi:Lateral organ boundaries (LOB) domain
LCGVRRIIHTLYVAITHSFNLSPYFILSVKVVHYSNHIPSKYISTKAPLYSTLHQYPCSLRTIHPLFLVSSSQVYIYNMPFSLDTSLACMNRNMANGTSSPCGACKFLRRRCVSDCVFAPYFSCDQGAARFAAIHKVFGASNVSKLLMHLPVADRCEAVITIAYEAQARIKDPVYGCVAQIFALQQQVCVCLIFSIFASL